MPGNRKNSGQFKPGQSGNPSGRPKMDAAVAKTIKKLTPKALKALEECLDSDNAKWSEKTQAASIILDRALGKAAQPIIGESTVHTDNQPATLEEMLAMAQEVMAGDEGAGDPTPVGTAEKQ